MTDEITNENTHIRLGIHKLNDNYYITEKELLSQIQNSSYFNNTSLYHFWPKILKYT